jgi:hypothetical protein
MNKIIPLSLVGVLSVFMLLACKRERVVHAGNESGQSDVYQPRQGVSADNPINSRDAGRSKINDHKLTGELIKVDLANNLITIRTTDTGMEQTFKLDNTTMVTGDGSPISKGKQANTKSGVKTLVGKEGEVVVVEFEDPSGPKLATSVDVK